MSIIPNISKNIDDSSLEQSIKNLNIIKISDNFEIIKFKGITYKIPYRTYTEYFGDYPYLNTYFEFQDKKIIGSSILEKLLMTRSHNGYYRSINLKSILESNISEICIPFLFILLGDYIEEVGELIYNELLKNDSTLLDNFLEVISENPEYFNNVIRGRINSFNLAAGQKNLLILESNLRTVINK